MLLSQPGSAWGVWPWAAVCGHRALVGSSMRPQLVWRVSRVRPAPAATHTPRKQGGPVPPFPPPPPIYMQGGCRLHTAGSGSHLAALPWSICSPTGANQWFRERQGHAGISLLLRDPRCPSDMPSAQGSSRGSTMALCPSLLPHALGMHCQGWVGLWGWQ